MRLCHPSHLKRVYSTCFSNQFTPLFWNIKRWLSTEAERACFVHVNHNFTDTMVGRMRTNGYSASKLITVESGGQGFISMCSVKGGLERIHVLCVPSHTTHFLQPLDVDIFKTHIGTALNNVIRRSPGCVPTTEGCTCGCSESSMETHAPGSRGCSITSESSME